MTSSITGTQSGITVNVGSTAQFAVSGFPNPTTAGAAHSVTVTAEDAYGNATPGYTGTVHFTSSDAQAVLPANYTFTVGDAGSHTFTNAVTLKTANLSQAITATDTVTGSITGSEIVTVNASTLAGIGLTNITQHPTPNLSCSGAVGTIVCTSLGEGSDFASSMRAHGPSPPASSSRTPTATPSPPGATPPSP